MDTPAYGAMGSSGRSWYRVESPKEVQHSRQGSYDSLGHQGSRPDSGNYNDVKYEATARQQETRRGVFDRVKKISDESSLSSHSSGGRTSSPNKMALQNRASHSPSPSKSHSSGGSRSRSPSPYHLKYEYQQQQRASPIPSPSRRIIKAHRASCPLAWLWR